MPRRNKSHRFGKPTYRHPVPKEFAILDVLRATGAPATFTELADSFDISEQRSQNALRRQLQRMADRGQLLLNRKGEYCLLEKIDVVTGVVSAHRDGFGFLVRDEGDADVHLSYREMEQLLDGDRIAVRVSTKRDGRLTGSVVEILDRAKKTAVGHYRREHGLGFVIETGKSPHHFLVPDHQRGGARSGDLVKIEITEYPSRRSEAQGKVVKVLGDPTEPGMATAVAIEQFALPVNWSPTVRRAAAEWGTRVRPSDKQEREDIRDLPLVTIDGADARDFDDAVYAEPEGDGWRLLVAIADVSHYVADELPLDLEARRRGTSVYFVDRVVPMLPESLSNGLCSLNPNVERLCMVCDMHVTATGQVTRSRFYRGVMRSAARLTYAEVDRWRQGGRHSPRKLDRLSNQINSLYDIFRIFSKRRRKRGALDLDLPEVRIDLADDGSIERISPRSRTDAHRLIEECMIAANVEAGKYLSRRRIAALYRVHDGPPEEKFEELRLLLRALGLKVTDQARTDPKHLNRVIQALQRRPDFHVLAVSVLRSLSQAVYQPANIGHYGLALKTYAHFTSPIRRYPDLLVHRAIGHLIDGGKPGAYVYDVAAMEQFGKSCSMLERRAEEAARAVESRYKCTFMLDHIGAEFQGTVTGIAPFGLFVTLDELYLDGLVHVSGLDNDYYHVQHGGLTLSGERTGRSYGLGDAVTVSVISVNVDEAKVDLVLVDGG